MKWFQTHKNEPYFNRIAWGNLLNDQRAMPTHIFLYEAQKRASRSKFISFWTGNKSKGTATRVTRPWKAKRVFVCYAAHPFWYYPETYEYPL